MSFIKQICAYPFNHEGSINYKADTEKLLCANVNEHYADEVIAETTPTECSYMVPKDYVNESDEIIFSSSNDHDLRERKTSHTHQNPVICRNDNVLSYASEDTEVGINDCCDISTAAELITLSSYTDNIYDIYDTSCETGSSGIQPVFTWRILVSFIGFFIFKPICCISFFTYGRFTGDYRLFTTCITVTGLFYFILTIETLIIYSNVKYDRMPMKRNQRLLLAVLETLCPLIFICVSFNILFFDLAIFNRVMCNSDIVDVIHIHLLTGLVIITTLSFSLLTLYNAMNFVFPRVWVVAMTRNLIPF